jgi:hypothetical protein
MTSPPLGYTSCENSRLRCRQSLDCSVPLDFRNTRQPSHLGYPYQ